MSKITSPQELTERLQRILRQASSGTPTRSRLAEEIKQVAEDLESAEGQQKTARIVPGTLPPLLRKSADALYNSRVLLRQLADAVHDLYEDATGTNGLSGYHASDEIKGIRDSMQDADHQIGIAANNMEYLARKLLKDTKAS